MSRPLTQAKRKRGTAIKTTIIAAFAFATGLGMGSVLVFWMTPIELPKQPVIYRYIIQPTTTTVPNTPLTPEQETRLREVTRTAEETPQDLPKTLVP